MSAFSLQPAIRTADKLSAVSKKIVTCLSCLSLKDLLYNV